MKDYSNYLGYFQRLPRIYRNKLFTEHERAFLASELEKQAWKKQDEQEQKDRDYMERHLGCEDPAVMRRRAFRQHIEKCAKLKSLQ